MLKQDAEFYRIALSLGLVDKDQVISWADSIILNQTNPPSSVYDISLSKAKGKGEVIEMLKLISEGDLDTISSPVFERIAGQLKKKLDVHDISSDKAAEMLYQMALQTKNLSSEYEQFSLWVDDEFSLVRQGIKERTLAEEALLTFLRNIESKLRQS